MTTASLNVPGGRWESMWAQGLEPGQFFDAKRSSPSLIKVLDARGTCAAAPSRPKALVPGCGRGYDVVEMARRGYDVLGLDISQTAVQAAEEYRDKNLEEGRERATYETTDFFQLKTEGRWEGGFDLVYDYTFLCALLPHQREDWAKTHRRLIAPGGELVTLIYPLRPGADTGEDTDGPPFAMSEKIVRGLLEKNGFVATMMEPVKAEDATAEYRIGKEILARWKLAAGASN